MCNFSEKASISDRNEITNLALLAEFAQHSQSITIEKKAAECAGISPSEYSKIKNDQKKVASSIGKYTFIIATKLLNPPCETFEDLISCFPKYYSDNNTILNTIKSIYNQHNADINSTSFQQNFQSEPIIEETENAISSMKEPQDISSDEQIESEEISENCSASNAYKILEQLFDSKKININERYTIQRAILYENYGIYPYRFLPPIHKEKINILYEIDSAPYIICVVFWDDKLKDEQIIQLQKDFTDKDIWIIFVCNTSSYTSIPTKDDLKAKGCILSYMDNHFHLHFKGKDKEIYHFLKKYGVSSITRSII